MAKLTVNIPENKLPAFMLLAKELDLKVVEKQPIVKKNIIKQHNLKGKHLEGTINVIGLSFRAMKLMSRPWKSWKIYI